MYDYIRMEAREKCARCLQPIASDSVRCTHCGQPIHNPRRLIFLMVAAAGVLAVIFMLVIMYRVVYLADLEEAGPVESEQSAAPAAQFSDASTTSQEAPPPPKDAKPPEPLAPDKPPPLNQ